MRRRFRAAAISVIRAECALDQGGRLSCGNSPGPTESDVCRRDG